MAIFASASSLSPRTAAGRAFARGMTAYGLCRRRRGWLSQLGSHSELRRFGQISASTLRGARQTCSPEIRRRGDFTSDRPDSLIWPPRLSQCVCLVPAPRFLSARGCTRQAARRACGMPPRQSPEAIAAPAMNIQPTIMSATQMAIIG